MPPAPVAKPAFDLKSTSWVLTALRLHSADLDALAAELQARFADSPGLFDDEAMVVDLSGLPDDAPLPDFGALLALLRRHGMHAVAVQGGSPAQTAAAQAAGLLQAGPGEAPAGRQRQVAPASAADASAEGTVAADPAPAEAAAAAPAIAAEATPAPDPAVTPAPAAPPAPPARMPTMVLDKPLRSGQRAYARGGDLVVLAAVSFGAEVIADGSIHVYGPLRGRAMAGARGDANARIFSTCMEPQLVSIAGIYRTTETPLAPDVLGKAAQVRLDGEKLFVEPLGS